MSDKKDLFPGLAVPEPPEDLRGQVVGRARQALEQGPRHDLWARIWESRQARLVWAASVLALAVGHMAVPIGDAGPAKEPSTLARAKSHEHEELSAITNLPRVSLDALPFFASTSAVEESEADPESAAPAAVSEENES